MKKKVFLTYILIFISLLGFAQTNKVDHPTLAIYKLLLDDSINIKDSLIIYALNFELSISRKQKGTIVTNIAANDNLAFKLFPSHKKFSSIDFSSLMGTKNKIKLVIPILIHGSSPEKMLYKDKEGRPLISLNAAVNAAYALYSPMKYDNQKDAEVSLSHRLYKDSQSKKPKSDFREVIVMDPITYEIQNIR